MTPLDVRKKLAADIEAKGLNLKQVSLAIGKSHSYLHQFISYGKPRFLDEPQRELLDQIFGLDVRGLKPPIDVLAVKQSGVLTGLSPRPRVGDSIKESREADIVDVWRQLSKEDQDLVMSILDGIRTLRWRSRSP